MTHILRDAFAYTPASTPLHGFATMVATLMTQRQLNCALAPYMLGNRITWRELSFFVMCATTYLTRKLYFPGNLTFSQVELLIEFITKRGRDPFDEVIVSLQNINAIHRMLGISKSSPWIRSLRYTIDADVSNTWDMSMWFPDFTRAILMEGGTIRNIPSHLVELRLENVTADEAIMEAIGEAPLITSLYIVNDADIVFRGLPQWLEKLTIDSGSDVMYIEDYSYDCMFLREMHILNDGELTELPESLVTSISQSLTYLRVVALPSEEKDYLGTVLEKLTRLQTLIMSGFTMREAPIPSWVEVLVPGDDYMEGATSWTPLPHLTELIIHTNQHMEKILRTSPRLRKLELRSKDTPVVLPDIICPSLESLEIDMNILDASEIHWHQIDTVLRLFPNISTYVYIGITLRAELDVARKSLSLDFSGGTNPEKIELVLSDSVVENYRITFHPYWDQRDSNIDVILPRGAKEVTIRVIKHRSREHDGIHEKTYITEELYSVMPHNPTARITVAAEYTNDDTKVTICLK